VAARQRLAVGAEGLPGREHGPLTPAGLVAFGRGMSVTWWQVTGAPAGRCDPRWESMPSARVLLRSVREVIVDAPHDRGVAAYADGERVGPLPLRVWTEPAGLLVVAPAAPHSRP